MHLTRPVARAEQGMVATPHYLSSIAALEVLRDGGNAVDAAVTAAVTLGSVLPHMTGIGGDAFWLIYDAKSKSLRGINGSGPSGRLVKPDLFDRARGIPDRGPRSAITVPGAVDSWRLAYSSLGSLPLARLFEPAIFYARSGTPVTLGIADWICQSAIPLQNDAGCSEVFFQDGKSLPEGARLSQPALAQTLESIASKGFRHFYDVTAQSVVKYLQSQDGLMTTDDFKQYQAEWVTPISTRYRDYEAFQLPPPSQGITGLMILNFLEYADIGKCEYNAIEYYDFLLKAIRWAFWRRDKWLTDPKFLNIPIDALLDPREARIAAQDATTLPTSKKDRAKQGSDTVFIATADKNGNAVGLVQSIYYDFGAAVLDPESGVLLQNRGAGFSLDVDHPNFLTPGKQSATTLMSGMLFSRGQPYMIHGTQGGEGQAQTNAAIITRTIDFGLDIQQAIEAPRVLFGRSWGDSPDQVLIESTVGDAVIHGLKLNGYPATGVPWPNPRMGTAQGIKLKGVGCPFFEGGADPRGEGLALGY